MTLHQMSLLLHCIDVSYGFDYDYRQSAVEKQELAIPDLNKAFDSTFHIWIVLYLKSRNMYLVKTSRGFTLVHISK